MIPITLFKGRKIAVFGLGMSGLASARALKAGGAHPVVWDDSAKGREAAQVAGLEPVNLAAADWREFAALILAPGVQLTHPKPHWTVEMARAAGVEVIGDTELFCRQRRAENSAAKVIAITGTNGKSTTTALTAHLIAASGRRVAMGGNIGTAVLDLPPFADDLTYVLEYSSFQIDLTPTLDANAACLLNITPDHLDRHGTIENYAAVKARIFDGVGLNGTAAIGVDDAISAAIADAYEERARVKRISVVTPQETGVFAEGHALIEVERGERWPPISLEGIGSLRGAHNAQNAATAFALCRAIGLGREEIARGLASFPGLAHRMEEVGRMGRVLFVNDSKATNADAAAKALASFGAIYWIAGGLAKAGGIEGLESFYPRIRHAYFIGDAAADFARHVGDAVPYTMSGTLDAAIRDAARDAARSAYAEPVVLLSPACASYDQFVSFTARGDAFRAAVSELDGISMKGAGRP